MTDQLFDEDLGDDLFEGGVTSDFLNLEALALPGFRDNGTRAGRHVLYYPETVVLDIEGDNGGTYNAVFGDLVVLDGPLTEAVTEIPQVFQRFMISGAFMVPGILGIFKIDKAEVLGGRDGEHALIPKDERRFFVTGRLDSIKNKNKTLSWKLLPLEDGAKPKAKAYHVKRLAALKSADPFA